MVLGRHFDEDIFKKNNTVYMYRWVPLKPDFLEHANLSGLSIIWLISTNLH